MSTKKSIYDYFNSRFSTIVRLPICFPISILATHHGVFSTTDQNCENERPATDPEHPDEPESYASIQSEVPTSCIKTQRCSCGASLK